MVQGRVLIGIDDLDKIKNISEQERGKLGKLITELKQQRQRNPVISPPPGGISMSEAERKYGIPNPTISRWVKRGYIPILTRTEWITYIDEAIFSKIAERYNKNPGKGKKTITKEIN